MTDNFIKHLITCSCILHQFKYAADPPQHQFVVFSVLNGDRMVQKFVQCNNCGIVHKVIDVCKSEIVVGREAMSSIISIDDIKTNLHPQLAALLEASSVELPSWEQASFILDNELWGSFIVLSSDEERGMRQGKFVRILGKNMFKVEQFTRDEVIK